MSQIYPRYSLDMYQIFSRYVASLEKGGMTWASWKAKVTLVTAQRCNQIKSLSRFFQSFDRLGDQVKYGVRQKHIWTDNNLSLGARNISLSEYCACQPTPASSFLIFSQPEDHRAGYTKLSVHTMIVKYYYSAYFFYSY